MIHLTHAAPNFPAVMGSIWLPVKAIRTPYWFSVALACVNFFAGELFQKG